MEVARLAGLLQVAAGMIGKTVDFPREQDDSRVGTMKDIENLAQRLETGNIGVMFIANADPVSQLPMEFQFGNRLGLQTLFVLEQKQRLWGKSVPTQSLGTRLDTGSLRITDHANCWQRSEIVKLLSG